MLASYALGFFNSVYQHAFSVLQQAVHSAC